MSTKTVEVEVDASELKGDEAKLVDKLVEFLKEKTSGDTSSDGKVVTVKGEGEALSKKYIRIIVKKFLHKHELTETFRVIADEEENTLKIKQRKLAEED